MVHVFKNIRKRLTAINYHSVSLLSVDSKFFEKLVNHRFVDHLEKGGLFSDFQYGIRPLKLTADFLKIIKNC